MDTHTEETFDEVKLDAVLKPVIAANPGLRPNDIATIALAEIGALLPSRGERTPRADRAAAVLVYVARHTFWDRAADQLGVEREPHVMDADEVLSETVFDGLLADAIERTPRADRVAAVLVYVARHTFRDRAADLLGVEREPHVMDADEALSEAVFDGLLADAIEHCEAVRTARGAPDL